MFGKLTGGGASVSAQLGEFFLGGREVSMWEYPVCKVRDDWVLEIFWSFSEV